MSGALEFLQSLQAECGGVIPIERYMQEALYHPELGYYARNIRTVGRRGDFATSASLGEALGSAIARWIRKNRISENAFGIWKGGKGENNPRPSLPHPVPLPVIPRNPSCFPAFQIPNLFPSWHVIEAGAGTGELARTVLRRLGMWGRRGLVYHIVETSPVLRAEQQRALPQFRVAWHDSMSDALAACKGRALIFSNELADAFPCRVFERRDGHWIEVGVRIEEGRVVECAFPRTPPEGLPADLPEGQRIEMHAAVAEWIATWSGDVREALMLTIDYGDTMPALYHRRKRGTLRAYFHHQRFEGMEIYHRFGKQDLTADVNFTDLRNWTEHCGWRTVALTTQGEFLAAYGARRSGLHDAQLADHTGAGAAFKVLECEKREDEAASGPTSTEPRKNKSWAKIKPPLHV
ncbi:MAG: class I SAM-dependent methyltransferase [Chthoniobacterales bacterium]